MLTSVKGEIAEYQEITKLSKALISFDDRWHNAVVSSGPVIASSSIGDDQDSIAVMLHLLHATCLLYQTPHDCMERVIESCHH